MNDYELLEQELHEKQIELDECFDKYQKLTKTYLVTINTLDNTERENTILRTALLITVVLYIVIFIFTISI